MRRLLTILIASMMLVCASGCGGVPVAGTGDDAATVTAPAEDKTISCDTDDLSGPTEILPEPLMRNVSTLSDAPESAETGFTAVFEGDWDSVRDKDIKARVNYIFQTTYPRLYARWGTGTEPRTVRFIADPDYDGVAYASDDSVVASVDYMNECPGDVGFFAHEITHLIQSYDADMDWWTEGMASYGGFRYFHWAHPDTLHLIDSTDDSIRGWHYGPYGNCILFFAYMDCRYPTRVTPEGVTVPGLIDSVNAAVKEGRVKRLGREDDGSTDLSRVIRDITGLESIEQLRSVYADSCASGEWTFAGFADYEDNFIVRDLPGVPDIPEIRLPDKTVRPCHQALEDADVITDNVLLNARVVRYSGYINRQERPEFICDGDPDTKWCSEESSITDACYMPLGVQHYILLDMGEVRTFDTYSILTGAIEAEEYATSGWELLVSLDGRQFTSVDCHMSEPVEHAAYNVGETTARYVLLKVLASETGGSTVRIYELAAGQ